MAQDTGTYSFAQNALPPLESGDFTLSIAQTVTIDGAAERLCTSAAFTVAGPRVRLDPSAIDSQFPPPGGQGDYSDVLPHMVFVDATLPWQRPAWVDLADPGVNRAPWLALLVFDEGDPAPAIQNLTLAALQQPAAGVYVPTFDLEGGEASTDPTSVINVPVALFNTIAPSFADLGWLAHVRTPPGAATGYSVVVANRFPAAGRQSVVHLVSLEGYGPALPPDTARGSNIPDAGSISSVRLVTLANWTFISLSQSQTFAAAVQALDASQAGMQLPAMATSGSGDAAVRAAFGSGYTAMNHTLRDGTPTVSWYRGPLLPIAAPAFALPDASVADDLLRYDPTVGMFDVTYAAAWQVGQLTALHNAAFSAALYRLKTGAAQAAAVQAAAATLDRMVKGVVGGDAAGSPGRAGRVAMLLHGLVEPAATALAGRRPAAAAAPGRRGRLRLTGDDLRAAFAGTEAAAESADLATVLNWMQGLAGFAGVPLNYLVPDIGMLPVESLRLFQVDMTWVAALTAGALSVGGPTPPALQAQIATQLAAAGLSGPLSGFLLRSSIISTWPNTVAEAYDADGNMLPVTTAALSSTLMLGLVGGTLARVDLMQPAQTLHFGADLSSGAVDVDLRYAAGSASVAAGSAAGSAQAVAVRPTSWQSASGDAVTSTTGSGTLQIDDFASAIAAAVWPAGTSAGTLTAAELGLQFVQESEAVSFDAQPAATDTPA